MLTARVGLDGSDKSLVKYTIIADVSGKDELEVLNFRRAWMQKFGKEMRRTAGARADIDGLRVRVVSPGWTSVVDGQQQVADALRELGVKVEGEK